MSHAASVDPSLTRGQLEQVLDHQIVLSLPGTDYRLHLELDAAHKSRLPAVGGRVAGVINAKARRVDRSQVGGRFIEPVYGRPRRVQGRVVAQDQTHRTLTVHCAPDCAMVVTLADLRQQPQDFAIGQLVGFDVEPGACFEPIK